MITAQLNHFNKTAGQIFGLFFSKMGAGGKKICRNVSFASGPHGEDSTHLETVLPTVWRKPPGFSIRPLSPLKINLRAFLGKSRAACANERSGGYLVWFSPACTSGKRPSFSARSDRSHAAAANGRFGSGWCLESSRSSNYNVFCTEVRNNS